MEKYIRVHAFLISFLFSNDILRPNIIFEQKASRQRLHLQSSE